MVNGGLSAEVCEVGRVSDTSASVNQILVEINILKSFMLNGDGYKIT